MEQRPPLAGYVHVLHEALRLSALDIGRCRLRRQGLRRVAIDLGRGRALKIRSNRTSGQENT